MVRSSSVACGRSRDAAIEPQMNAGDRRMLEALEVQIQFRNHGRQALERQRARRSNPPSAARLRPSLRELCRLSTITRSTGARGCNPNIGDALPALPGHTNRPSGTAGIAHLVGIRASQEAQPENLKSVAGGHAIQVFVDRADQNLIPEAPDGRARSGASPAAIRACVMRSRSLRRPCSRRMASIARAIADLVGQTQKRQFQEAAGEVQRRRAVRRLAEPMSGRPVR